MSEKAQRHHTLFERVLWTANPELKRLRNTPELIPKMDVNAHRSLHRAVELVPAPDHHMIDRINKEFYPARKDTVGTIKNLQEAVRLAMGHEMVQDIAFGVGQLIIDSLQLQIGFIELSEALGGDIK